MLVYLCIGLSGVGLAMQCVSSCCDRVMQMNRKFMRKNHGGAMGNQLVKILYWLGFWGVGRCGRGRGVAQECLVGWIPTTYN